MGSYLSNCGMRHYKSGSLYNVLTVDSKRQAGKTDIVFMNSQSFLSAIKTSKGYNSQIVHSQVIPGRDAVFSDVDPPFSYEIRQSLVRMGVNRLFSHQAEAINAARQGDNFVVVTSTASGKTLCYNLPVIESLEKDSKARALYIYPTKALAQDQLGKLMNFGLPFIKAATYDGDTPKKERPFIKSTANVILTNPDMLHVGILPYHSSWADMFRNLKYVVIDEVHSYRGVFGAHVGNILRRLRRIAKYYGSNPQFLCASATINNPAELVNELIGIDAKIIDKDGSPSGKKTFIFWNPPFLVTKGERRSANSEAVGLFTKLVESGIRTIVFTKARKTAELILRYARASLKENNSISSDKIMAYRAGYKPSERRKIEKKLFSGELLGVTSTSALEVGVDIGGLDAVVMTGYPGTVASTWQQAGRSGRGTEESIAVLIAIESPLDQYIMRNPSYFFSSDSEKAIVDTQNPYILADHLLCAAYELPIENDEVEEVFGNRTWEVLATLADAGQLKFRRRWHWTGFGYPAMDVNIRSASGDNYSIVSVEGGGELLGTVDSSTAFETVHPGAVYLHSGESYVVNKLDLIEMVAYVEKSEVNYYTTPGSVTHIAVENEECCTKLNDAVIHFGDVVVSNKVTHFLRKQLFSDTVIGKIPLDLPEMDLNTESIWIEMPDELSESIVNEGYDLPGTIHAIEHAAIGMLPLFALCDRNDIGGVSHPSHPDVDGRSAIFIYDGHVGGVGISRVAYERIGELLAATLKTLEDCECDFGCPSCVQSPKCGNNNEPLDKLGAVFALRELLKVTDSPI